jgi:hypothetical protein
LSASLPLVRIPVGVLVERRKATSPWLDVVWRPVAVLSGEPTANPWTQLKTDGEVELFYAGMAEIGLYRRETDSYRSNLASVAPSVWVALQGTDGDPPYQISAVTADPAEGEGFTEPGTALVEAVPMPAPVRDAIAAFVAEHHVEHQVFKKRERDRADPEALARRGPKYGNGDERS